MRIDIAQSNTPFRVASLPRPDGQAADKTDTVEEASPFATTLETKLAELEAKYPDWSPEHRLRVALTVLFD